MATTYYADNYRDPIPSLPNPTLLVREFVYTIAAAFVINDVVKLAPLQSLTGLVLTSFEIDVPALDSSTGIVSAVGDNTTAAKYITGSTVGRSAAGGKISHLGTGVVLAGMPGRYTADNDLAFKVTTAATGTASTSGTFKGWCSYFYQGRALVL